MPSQGSCTMTLTMSYIPENVSTPIALREGFYLSLESLDKLNFLLSSKILASQEPYMYYRIYSPVSRPWL